MRTLAMLPVGRSAIILRLHGGGPLLERLLALGFTRGARVTHLYNAPFGDPAAFRVRGTTLALRLQEASQVELESETVTQTYHPL